MNQFRAIRERLGMSQAQLAKLVGMTDGNWGHYEKRGQQPKPETAKRLLDVCKELGLELNLGHVYGLEPLPQAEQKKDAPVEASGA